MNRNQFLTKLAAELSILPKEEIEAAMEFYTEFFDDVGEENEEEAIKNLGEPHKIAAQIKADYAVRQIEDESEEKSSSPKKYLSAAKAAILGVFAAPIAIPLAIVMGCVVIAIFAAWLAIVVGVGACIAAGIVCAVFAIGIGIATIPTSIASAVMMMGLGVALLGVLLMAMSGIIVAVRAIFRKLVIEVHKSNENRKMRKIAKEKAKFSEKGGAENEQI